MNGFRLVNSVVPARQPSGSIPVAEGQGGGLRPCMARREEVGSADSTAVLHR